MKINVKRDFLQIMVAGVGNNRLRKRFMSDFSYYFNNPELSDIMVQVVGCSDDYIECSSSDKERELQSSGGITGNNGTDTFYAHKFVLSARSPVLMRMLSSSMMEAASSVISMQFSKDTVQCILRYLYSGQIDLVPALVLDVLSCADYYSLEELREYCGWYSMRICMEGDPEMDICKVLYAAERYRLDKIKTLCFEFITQHSMDILLSSPNWHLLTEDSVIAILKQDSLRVPEVEIFDSLVRWAKKQYSILKDISCEEIVEIDFLKKKLQKPLECIRFASMSSHQLSKHIEASGLVDRDIMYEAYRYLATKETPKQLDMAVVRQGVTDFTFSTPGDTKGVFYYFGTVEDTDDYESPSIRKTVKVSSSSMSIGYPTPFVSRTPTNMYTDKLPNSYYSVDIGSKYVLCPNYYTMRYAGDSQGSIYAAPKNWQLLGSLDGEQWDILTTHHNDTSLKEGYSISGWPIDSIHSYRHLKIQMTGPNQRDGDELCVCCFEVYGRLVKLEEDSNLITEENDSSE
ncbi:hypothetical protein PPL_05618 [Heterostelium album PN500]|uniref:BTB domain-containing protein n=1 Tax=Heterostelium pallidum (strain ATCC 26659 / Pp 5 / PN500) TaxID=670386 RepID=D3BAP0_HETP5|nr:hypothetical protein PPL_05618 [Heterostelium album PN500]EFA81627.1 hypothetical protein PPL_05618 [Heterostelium album PN500]|eukprot:XP_020433744.1 hypothetical protein PPL_05618 [Heterostelium album PN500]